jgi:hypothetical protein
LAFCGGNYAVEQIQGGIVDCSPHKVFVIELGAIAGIKLKDAMLSNRVRDRNGDRLDNNLIQLIERGCQCQSAAGSGSGGY